MADDQRDSSEESKLKWCTLSFTISLTIKFTTLIGLMNIALDVMNLFDVFDTNSTIQTIKNSISVSNAVIFSLSSTLYIFKFNQDILHNDITNLCTYYRNSDLRIKGLEIIEETEKLNLSPEQRFMFRDSILFRTKLKHAGLVLGLLFFYFNSIAYAKIYYHEPLGNNTGTLKRNEIYMLNLYISVISPILSILFSYITVLCDNIIVVKNYVKAINEHRDQEDYLFDKLLQVIEYPLLSVFTFRDETSIEPTG